MAVPFEATIASENVAPSRVTSWDGDEHGVVVTSVSENAQVGVVAALVAGEAAQAKLPVGAPVVSTALLSVTVAVPVTSVAGVPAGNVAVTVQAIVWPGRGLPDAPPASGPGTQLFVTNKGAIGEGPSGAMKVAPSGVVAQMMTGPAVALAIAAHRGPRPPPATLSVSVMTSTSRPPQNSVVVMKNEVAPAP
jgi:hypothetical protein